MNRVHTRALNPATLRAPAALARSTQAARSGDDLMMAGGPDHNFLRLMIRDRLAKGTLFPAPERVWAKHGTGRICSACGTAISPQDAESEMIVGLVTVWAHLTCHMIWQEESGGDRVERAGVAGPRPTAAPPAGVRPRGSPLP